MKKTILVYVFVLVNLQLQAQGWKMFPLDSLRYYVNPLQQNKTLGSRNDRITGIGFRDYTQTGDTIQIDVSGFSRIEQLHIFPTHPGAREAYLINGNSNFGNHIISNRKETLLVFTEAEKGNIKHDTIKFTKGLMVTETWKLFENDTIKVTGKYGSLVPFGQRDSIRNFPITVLNKLFGTKQIYQIRMSKNLGLIQSISYYDLLNNQSDTNPLPVFQLFPYHEVTEMEFLRPASSSELQVKRVTSIGGGPPTTEWIKTDYEKQFLDTLYYKQNLVRQSYVYDKVNHTYTSEVVKYADVRVKKTVDTIGVFNPIPGQRIYDGIGLSSYFHELGGYFRCGEQVLLSKWGGGGYFEELHGDTIFLFISVGHTDGGYNETMEHAGLIKEDFVLGSQTTRKDWEYVEIDESCKLGVKSWRHSGIDSIEDEGFNIYPNPGSNTVYLENMSAIRTVIAMDMAGNLFPINIENNELDVSSLPSGIYILQIQSHYKLITHKIQILHE